MAFQVCGESLHDFLCHLRAGAHALQHLQGGVPHCIGVALAPYCHECHFFLRGSKPLRIHVSGDFLLPKPQVILRDDEETAFDIKRHQPCRYGAAADQDEPYILTPRKGKDSLPPLCVFQQVHIIYYHDRPRLRLFFLPGTM